MTQGTSDQSVSYERDVRPLFRERDRGSMKRFFDLWSYEDVRDNADAILERVSDGSMPCDSEWPQEQVDLFQRWMDAGTPA
jgi:hypothetical protein